MNLPFDVYIIVVHHEGFVKANDRNQGRKKCVAMTFELLINLGRDNELRKTAEVLRPLNCIVRLLSSQAFLVIKLMSEFLRVFFEALYGSRQHTANLNCIFTKSLYSI